jgi:hypothetical protein
MDRVTMSELSSRPTPEEISVEVFQNAWTLPCSFGSQETLLGHQSGNGMAEANTPSGSKRRFNAVSRAPLPP